MSLWERNESAAGAGVGAAFLVGLVVGFALATALWFALSPEPRHGRELVGCAARDHRGAR